MALQPTPSLFPFLSNYQIHKKLPYSSQTVLLNPSTQHFLLMKQILPQSFPQLKQSIQSLQSHLLLKHPHLLTLQDYTSHSLTIQSQTFPKITTFYQYSGHNLLQQTNSRIQQNRLFDQNQLWNILCSIVFSLSYLQKSQIGHGCVSLLDIFITSDGALKIVDPSISSVSPSDYSEGYYYSPEMFEFFVNKNIEPEDIDIYRSDVFSLGLCMLHVATLDELDRVMDYENCCVDFDELEEKVRVVGEYYSEQFVRVLVGMLAESFEERPDFVELEEYLVDVVNQKDCNGNGIRGIGMGKRGDVTLSMQFEYLTQRQEEQTDSEDDLLQPSPPDLTDINSETTGIPIISLDIQTIDIPHKSQVSNSIKLLQQPKPSYIILTQSLSFHNTQRSTIDKKPTQQIQQIVFKKTPSKQNQQPRESLISEIELMVRSSKDNLSLVNNLFSVKQIIKDTSNIPLGNNVQSKQKEEKKGGVPALGKVVARKWNVVRQPPKQDSKIKAFVPQQPQNQKNKLNSTTNNKLKKTTVVPENKVIKRAKPVSKSPPPKTVNSK